MHQAVSGLFAFTLLLPNLENLFFFFPYNWLPSSSGTI